MADKKVHYGIELGGVLLHTASVTMTNTAVGLALLAHLRGERLSPSAAIRQAHDWLVEAREILEQDIGVPVPFDEGVESLP